MILRCEPRFTGAPTKTHDQAHGYSLSYAAIFLLSEAVTSPAARLKGYQFRSSILCSFNKYFLLPNSAARSSSTLALSLTRTIPSSCRRDPSTKTSHFPQLLHLPSTRQTRDSASPPSVRENSTSNVILRLYSCLGFGISSDPCPSLSLPRHPPIISPFHRQLQKWLRQYQHPPQSCLQ